MVREFFLILMVSGKWRKGPAYINRGLPCGTCSGYAGLCDSRVTYHGKHLDVGTSADIRGTGQLTGYPAEPLEPNGLKGQTTPGPSAFKQGHLRPDDRKILDGSLVVYPSGSADSRGF